MRDAIPKQDHAEAKPALKTLLAAETRAACEWLRDQFSPRYQALAPKAIEHVHHD